MIYLCYILCISIKIFVSFHELGVYDLPAMISYITNTTSQKLITYIGYSMGTTASYVMAAERPDIARMVQAIISLAPIAFVEYIKSPIRHFAPFVNKLEVNTIKK